MKNFLLITLASISLSVLSQNFEGKIIYTNTYKSKTDKMTDEQFNSTMGTRQEYMIKGGDYKSLANGTYMSWQLYLNKDNKVYSQFATIPSILWVDASSVSDEIISSSIKKNAVKILGYDCHELTLTCKSGVQKYYYSSKLPVDAKLFEKHKYGNWYDYLSKANAVPLKSVIENSLFVLTSTATEVKPMKLDTSIFTLPEGVKVEKSPF